MRTTIAYPNKAQLRSEIRGSCNAESLCLSAYAYKRKIINGSMKKAYHDSNSDTIAKLSNSKLKLERIVIAYVIVEKDNSSNSYITVTHGSLMNFLFPMGTVVGERRSEED